MPRPNDLLLAKLLDEVGSAIAHNIPIIEALTRVAIQQHGNTAVVARFLLTSLKRGASLESCFAKLDLEDGEQIIAAIQGAEQTGNPELLHRLSETLRIRHDLKKTLTLNWFYPCILCVVAYLMFVTSLAPLIRNNQGLITQWPSAVVHASHWIESFWMLPPCVAILFIIPFAFTFMKPKRLPAAISQSLFYSTLASQLEGDIPESQAIRTAALMGGDTALLETENASFSTPRVVELLNSKATSYLTQAGSESQTTEREQPNQPESAAHNQVRCAHLRQLANTFERKAQRRAAILHHILPQAFSFALGFSFIVATAVFFIAPIYTQAYTW
jgi:hypothetical protein